MREKTVTTFEDLPLVRIVAQTILAPYFQSIFQAGFLFRCPVGLSIGDLLFRQLALNAEIVEEKVSTVFLDGQCVDDIASAILKDGSIVALSSALPGLAGATLRRGGFYACLRDSITYHKEDKPAHPQEGTITVKLFNILMGELGPIFLRKGIIMSRSAIVSFFQAQKEYIWREIKAVHFGSIRIAPHELSEESTYGSADYVTIRIDERNKPQ